MSLYQIGTTTCAGMCPVLIALPGLGCTAFCVPLQAFEGIADAGITVYAADYGTYVDSIDQMAAAVWAAIEVAKRLGKGKTVVTIVPDSAERYLSKDIFNFKG